jgi:hypothetical protein
MFHAKRNWKIAQKWEIDGNGTTFSLPKSVQQTSHFRMLSTAAGYDPLNEERGKTWIEAVYSSHQGSLLLPKSLGFM